MKEFKLTIDGQATDTQHTFAVINPADETIVAQCPMGTIELANSAVAAARRAFPFWCKVPDAERVAKLEAIAALIDAHRSELSEIITLEQGKTQSGPGANAEIGGASVWTRATAALQLTDLTVKDDSTGRIIARRRPIGVVCSITPWNWPLLIAIWHVMPAIRIGCTVVIKPSPYTPLSTLRLVEIMNHVLPPGVINVVTGDADVGRHLTSHPDVDKVVFTGSTATGKGVMSNAAQRLKRVTLELGGNDAGIILPETKIEPLLEKLFWGCFVNGGQTCASLKRLYVHEGIYDEVVRLFADFCSKIPVGNGMEKNNLIGPVSNLVQLEKVMAYVEDARQRGARIVIGGERANGPGYFYPLTLVADATDEMRVVSEEQFGPVIPMIRYRSVDEAIERANALDVGLGGSVWGNDPMEAAQVAERLECGTAWVNQHGAMHPLAPFGGIKGSGVGVEFNLDGLKEYTTINVINIAL